ncbi:hypothetical protein [Pseudomonas sp. LFM046]|uniref:sensor histidine kinase n=1 Tax=Pseudomonas sp. LFM046 TaxID=1608357 RepID=UPI001F5B93E4|nr:hypothetical protein [Pseudomonas sp. LFM046]
MTDRIRRNASDAAQQVAALLQLARIPESSHLMRVPLRQLIEHEVEPCQPLLRDKPLTIEVDAPEEVTVQAIPDLVAIAVGNLLRNACLHTELGGHHGPSGRQCHCRRGQWPRLARSSESASVRPFRACARRRAEWLVAGPVHRQTGCRPPGLDGVAHPSR